MKKYENIYEILSKNRDKQFFDPNDLLPREKQEIPDSITTPTSIKPSMKDELKIFLKSQLNPDLKIGSTSLDSISYYDFK
jgi:hypothetical protein